MKRWPYLALAAVVLAAGAYMFLKGPSALGSLFVSSGARAAGVLSGSPWHTIERPGDGFKVDLPDDGKNDQAPAYNETGGSETVHMLLANGNGDITYAVTWQDNPPVARVSKSSDRTLNAARDGMLARTETTILSESRGYHRSYPCLDVMARNNAGGILNARLFMAENRLYVLMALFPSEAARSEKNVNRFFDSLVPAQPAAIPENMPRE